MDKMTNGYVKIPKGKVNTVRKELKKHFEELAEKEFNVKGLVEVNVIPIERVLPSTEETLGMTHAYKVRIRA